MKPMQGFEKSSTKSARHARTSALMLMLRILAVLLGAMFIGPTCLKCREILLEDCLYSVSGFLSCAMEGPSHGTQAAPARFFMLTASVTTLQSIA